MKVYMSRIYRGGKVANCLVTTTPDGRIMGVRISTISSNVRA